MRFQPSTQEHYRGALGWPWDEKVATTAKDTVGYYKVGDDLYRLNEENKTAVLVLSSGTRVSADKEYDAVKQLLKDKKGKKITEEAAIKLMKSAKASVSKSSGLTAALIGKTWNDGQYTYVIDRNGNITIGSKTYTPSDSKYAAISTNLSRDYLDKKLTTGAAPEKPKPVYVPPAAPVAVPAPAATTDVAAPAGEVPLMEQPWFWPAVIGGTVVAGGAIWYFFLRTPSQPYPGQVPA
jgi:hypothetical protein